MLSADFGRAILLWFIVLPLAIAAAASVLTVVAVRRPARLLAIGVYVMVASVLIVPAGLVLGDDHLGRTHSQVLAFYGDLFWMIGVVAALVATARATGRDSLGGLGLSLLLVTGTVYACLAILAGPVGGLVWWFASARYPCASVLPCTGTPVNVVQAAGVMLVPLVGTLLVLGVARALTGRLTWAGRRPLLSGAVAAVLVAAYVYVRGPVDFSFSLGSGNLAGIDVAILPWLPMLGLALAGD